MGEANITWVTDQIATGGDFSYLPDKAERQLAELLSMDIDLVIDCRIEDNDEAIWEQTDVEYVHLPTDDAEGHTIPEEHFYAAFRAARPVLDEGGRVFVHCHMGVNRGPSTAFALLVDMGYTAPIAFDLIREKRPEAGLYYAEEALVAAGGDLFLSEADQKVLLDEFRQHRDRVFTRKDWDSIKHVIRNGHERDAVEREASMR